MLVLPFSKTCQPTLCVLKVINVLLYTLHITSTYTFVHLFIYLFLYAILIQLKTFNISADFYQWVDLHCK